MDVPVYNISGKQVGSMKIDEQAFGGEVNAALLKQAYVRYHANTRQGSARTKNRRQVEGSTRKIYRQKGTGNADPKAWLSGPWSQFAKEAKVNPMGRKAAAGEAA